MLLTFLKEGYQKETLSFREAAKKVIFLVVGPREGVR